MHCFSLRDIRDDSELRGSNMSTIGYVVKINVLLPLLVMAAVWVALDRAVGAGKHTLHGFSKLWSAAEGDKG